MIKKVFIGVGVLVTLLAACNKTPSADVLLQEASSNKLILKATPTPTPTLSCEALKAKVEQVFKDSKNEVTVKAEGRTVPFNPTYDKLLKTPEVKKCYAEETEAYLKANPKVKGTI